LLEQFYLFPLKREHSVIVPTYDEQGRDEDTQPLPLVKHPVMNYSQVKLEFKSLGAWVQSFSVQVPEAVAFAFQHTLAPPLPLKLLHNC